MSRLVANNSKFLSVDAHSPLNQVLLEDLEAQWGSNPRAHRNRDEERTPTREQLEAIKRQSLETRAKEQRVMEFSRRKQDFVSPQTHTSSRDG